MHKLSIELPKHRLFLHFRVAKRRKSVVEEAMIASISQVKKKYHKGTLISRFFRHIFEHKNIGKVLGTGLSLIVIFSAYFPPQSVAFAQEDFVPTTVETSLTLITIKGIQFPTRDVRVTQGYSFFHPGLDLDGFTGDPIHSIKTGRVASVSYSKFAYGNSVTIDHGNELTSLYAHLSKIEVKEGQEVTMDTEIGKMGATGRAFGDHLHLEIYDHGKAINPLTVLSR
ncbi:MAG: M23 family metallopeptidase [Patescibacteria group bacterium]